MGHRPDSSTTPPESNRSGVYNDGMNPQEGVDARTFTEAMTETLKRIPEDARLIITATTIPVIRDGTVVGEVRMTTEEVGYFVVRPA
jgi:hypothetical protein